MLYTATSVVVEDPMILFTTTFDAISNTLGAVEFLDLDIDIKELDRGTLTTLGLDFITLTNFSKLVMVFSAFIYMIFIIIEYPPTNIVREEWMHNWKRSTVPRMILLWIWGFNVASFFVNIVGTDVNGLNGTFLRNTKTVFTSFTDLSTVRSALVDPQYQNIIQDLVVGSILLLTFYVIAFYKHYEYGAVVLMAAMVQNVDKSDDLLQDNVLFETNLWLMIIMSVVMLAVFFRFCWDNKKDYEVVLQIVPDILYKVGNILCIVSLFFMFISIQYDWLDFDFKPSGISSSVAFAIEDAAQRIDSVVQTLGDVASALDPCTHRAYMETVEDTFAVTDSVSLDQSLMDARKGIRDTTDFNTAVCIGAVTPFDFINLEQPQCTKVKDEFDEHRQSLIDAFVSNAAMSGLKEYDPTTDHENEFFVDQACVDAKCTALTVITVAAVATSFIPFFSGVSKAASMAARAAFRVFKIGRRLTKSLPRMIKKRRKIKRLASRILRLASATTGRTGFVKELSIIYLPIITLATAAVAIIMFRRGVRHSADKNGYAVVGTSNSIAFRIIIGLFCPLALAESAFYMTLHIMPIVVDEILKELPSVLVESKLDVNIGYTSLKLAYFFSSVGAIMVVVSAILFAFENSLLACVQYFVSGTKYVYNKLTKKRTVVSSAGGANGGANGGRWSKCKHFCYKLTLLLTNWNTPYFQPLVFASPAIYFIYRGIINNEKYIIVSYGGNDDVARATDEILETVLHKERSEGMFIDFDAMNCGAVAKLVAKILDAVPGGLQQINIGLSEFANVITGAFSDAHDFISHLSDLVDLDFIHIEIPDIFPSAVTPWLIFGLPILAISALVTLWLMSVLIDGFGDIKNLITNDDPATHYYVSESKFYGSVTSATAMFVFYISVINVLVHIIVGTIIANSFNVDIPFVKINSELGPAYYGSQYASLFILMGAISIYINALIPIYH